MYRILERIASYIGFVVIMIGPVMLQEPALFCMIWVSVWIGLLFGAVVYDSYQHEKRMFK